MATDTVQAELAESRKRVALLEAQLVLAASRKRVALLEAQLVQEKEHSSIARSHHAADYELLRTRVVRNLSRQSRLLEDGLHAIRHGRYLVAEEFADRALADIDQEVRRLLAIGNK